MSIEKLRADIAPETGLWCKCGYKGESHSNKNSPAYKCVYDPQPDAKSYILRALLDEHEHAYRGSTASWLEHREKATEAIQLYGESE